MSAVFYRRGKSRPQVERAEEDCVDEIRDAKRIPDQERLTEAKPIIARYTRGNPGGGHPPWRYHRDRRAKRTRQAKAPPDRPSKFPSQ
jgi:hypothetical protein